MGTMKAARSFVALLAARDLLQRTAQVAAQLYGRIRLLGRHEIAFDEPLNLLFHTDQVLPGHSNGMRFTAHDAQLQVLAREEYYSIGGGFIVQAGVPPGSGDARALPPYEFDSAARLLELARQGGLEIHELMLARE